MSLIFYTPKGKIGEIMAQEVYLTNGIDRKKGLVGFSWTILLFGCLVALWRKDWLWFFIFIFTDILSVCLLRLFFCFWYNKSYTTRLLEKGFIPEDEYSKHILAEKGYI